MAYADLTTEQTSSLDAWMRLLRSTAGELARMNNHAEVVNTEYTENMGTILGLLANDDIIPNSSGLDGAEPITKAQAVTVVSYLQGVLAYNTQAHRGNIAKACGETNLIG